MTACRRRAFLLVAMAAGVGIFGEVPWLLPKAGARRQDSESLHG
jgi:hypothetical protein